jgi:uncharacterized peroxidase-related enzyme
MVPPLTSPPAGYLSKEIPMTTLPIHTIESAPEGARSILEAAQKRFGFVPNLLGELASAPPALKGYMALSELFGSCSLSPVAQQVLLLSVSRANKCSYCVAAHSAGLKMAGAGQELIDDIRTGRRLTDPALNGLAVFVAAVVEQRGEVTEEQIRAFLSTGYRPDQILEVLLGVAMKTLSNYTNHIAATPLDASFRPFEWSE